MTREEAEALGIQPIRERVRCGHCGGQGWINVPTYSLEGALFRPKTCPSCKGQKTVEVAP